jgi:phytanoyl-CoA hydroxylase
VFEKERELFDRQGFVVIPRLLNAVELADLQAQLERYIQDVVPKLNDADAFYQDRSRPETLKQMQRMGHDAYFRDYPLLPRWKDLAGALLGEPAVADEPEWFNKPPGTRHVTPPHQDNYYFCLVPSNVLTIWLALDYVDTENGCMRYVEGSHRNGIRPHAQSRILGFSQGITDYSADDFRREVAVPLQPGDAVAHHGMTIHRADANLSEHRHRRSFAMVFRGVSCQRDEAAFARYREAARAQHQEMGLTT